MTAKMTPNAEALEALVDRMGLKGTVELLAIICGEKAQHIAVNWQDVKTAKTWAADARWLDITAAAIEN